MSRGLGDVYKRQVTDRSQITTQQLGLTHYEVVLPRMMKQTDTQQQRTRKKGEVFSPAWVCNKMNNALDADWFGGLGAGETAGQFTVELPQGWQTVETPVQFNLFDDIAAQEQQYKDEEIRLERERKIQEAMLGIKKKFGKNAVLKGTNYLDGATMRERNQQIGGHKAK